MISIIEGELRRLWDRDGFLTPAQVLSEASSPESLLHQRFDWDDTTAAAKYRLDQARQLIRSCKITIETKPDTFVRVRSFVSVPDTYMPTEEALSDPATRDVVMQQALREIQTLRLKYRGLVDFDEALQLAMRSEQKAA